MSDEENAAYNDGLSAIEKAITDIQEADTKEKVQELLDNAINGVSAETKKAMEDLEKLKTDELNSLQGYVNALSKVEGLTEADKTRVKSLVEEASAKVKAANSETAVTTEVSKVETILESGFRNVAMTKAVDEAVEALEAYKDSSKLGMNAYIDGQIEDIKDMLTDSTKKMSDVEDAVSAAKAVADPLKKAQEEAYATLQEYRDYVAKDTSLDEAQKGIINGELDTVLQSVNDADAEAEVTAALTGLDDFMDTYKEVKDGVALENAKKELTKLYNDYLVELAPYLASSSENVKPIAENAKASMKKIAEPEVTFTTAIEVTAAKSKLTELYEGKSGKSDPTAPDANEFYNFSDLKDKDIVEGTGDVMENFVGYKTILEYNDTLAKKNDKEDKEKLAETLKNAEATLALYEQVLKDDVSIEELELTSEDIANIQKWIDSTRTTIKAAKGASEVTAAMNLLNGDDSFLATYYPTYKDVADNYDLIHTKAEVLEKLKELQEQYKDADEDIYGDVKDEIDNAIDTGVESKTKAEDVRGLLTKIEKEIDDANKKSELERAKQEAIEKLTLAFEKANDNEELKGKITSTISEITALDYNETTKNTPEDVKKIIDKADKEIQTLLEQIEKDRVEKLNKSKADVIKKIDQYIEVAKVAENSAVTSQLDRYRNAANSAQTQEELDKIYSAADATKESGWTSEFYIYLKKSCEVLDTKYEEIYKTSTGVKDTYKTETDPEVLALVNKAIEDIKAVKAATKDEATTAITKIKNQLNTDVNAVKTANNNINTKKTQAIEDIDTEIAKYSKAIQSQLNQAVKQYKEKINAVVKDDKQYETTISNYKDAAINLIKELAEQKIIATVTTEESKKVVDNTKLTKAQTENKLLGKTVDEFISDELTCVEVSADNYKVSGKLNKITDFTAFSSTESNGFYLPLVIENDFAQKITCELAGEGTIHEHEEKELKDGDNVLIAKITNKETQKIIVRYYSKADDEEPAKMITYNLSGLTLEEE